MATSIGNTLIGAATVSLAAWVTAAGAGTFVDIGHHEAAVEITWKTERAKFSAERLPGVARSYPHTHGADIKIKFKEMTIADATNALNMMNALGLATTAKSGAAPNLTMFDDGPIERYQQMKITGPGVGTTGVRTYTFWRCAADGPPTIAITKTDYQSMEVTFEALCDESVAAGVNGQFFKVVDA